MKDFINSEQEVIKLCEKLNNLNSLQEVEDLGIMAVHTLKRLITDGEITAVKIRGRWKIFKSELELYFFKNLSKNRRN